jgi:nicotinamide-nucleotide amidase
MIFAEILAIGSEMLTPFRLDTNSLYLTRTLEERGVAVIAKMIVGDVQDRIIEALDLASRRSNVIICSGGLGPTIDDITKEAAASFLGLPLELRPDVLVTIEERFRRRGLRMPEGNRRQAMIPAGGTVLPNPNGSAPGVYLESKGRQFFLLPGPPFELEAMWEQYGLPLVGKDRPLQRLVLRVAMLPESKVDEMLGPVTGRLRATGYTILASPGEIEIHFLAPEDSAQELASAAEETRKLLGHHVYAEGAQTLEEVVGRMLRESGKKIAVAESCTGGLLGSRITDVPGSSTYFERGVVAYSNRAKVELLSVPEETIRRSGAVSEPVARAMAEGIRRLARVDVGIAITGIAGPDGGTAEKPVGTVFVGLAVEGNETVVERFSFPGGRNRIKFFSSQAALNMLRLRMLKGD